jgi:hypothetical protein
MVPRLVPFRIAVLTSKLGTMEAACRRCTAHCLLLVQLGHRPLANARQSKVVTQEP